MYMEQPTAKNLGAAPDPGLLLKAAPDPGLLFKDASQTLLATSWGTFGVAWRAFQKCLGQFWEILGSLGHIF